MARKENARRRVVMNQENALHSLERMQQELNYRRAIKLLDAMREQGLISEKEELKIEENLRQIFPPFMVEIWPESLAITDF
jgi:hypothetical protein